MRNLHDPELWQRVAAHDLDADAPPGWFAGRLAREHGWSLRRANRVVEEYRRYAYLTCIAGHVVVPSEAVDAAWHQHLLDTAPYWDDFCKRTLRRPLHHRPSKGNVGDRQRHVELYERTLATYEREFGHKPPPDLWPPASQRFGRDLHQRKVQLSDVWVVPKRPVLRVAATLTLTGLASLAIAAAPKYAASINPFDLRGGPFLALFAGLFVGALMLSLLARRRALDPPGDGIEEAAVDPYEAATLATSAHLSSHSRWQRVR